MSRSKRTESAALNRVTRAADPSNDCVKAHDLLDAHQITFGLWQGSRPPIGPKLKEAKFDMVVLCDEDFQPDASLFQGVEVVYAPNEDDLDSPITEEQLCVAKKAATKVANAIIASKCVLVTCRAGLNRSGLVSGLVLHNLYGWPGSRCIEHVRARRRWPGSRGLRPLHNDSFVAVLKTLRLKSPRIQPPDPWEMTPSGLYIPKR